MRHAKPETVNPNHANFILKKIVKTIMLYHLAVCLLVLNLSFLTLAFFLAYTLFPIFNCYCYMFKFAYPLHSVTPLSLKTNKQ